MAIKELKGMTKPRVLMVGPALEVRGGISAVARCYLSSSLSSSTDITYLSTHREGTRAIKFLTALIAYIKFCRFYLAFSPDIIHILTSSYFSFYRKSIIFLFAKLLRKRVILHIHGSEFDKFHDTNIINALLIKVILDYADKIIVLSKAWRQIIGHYTNNRKLCILYNPINYTHFEHMHPWEKKSQSQQVLFLGRIGRRKGVYDILEAVPQILSYSSDVKFIFAGDGEIEKAKVISKEKGIQDYVEFVGWADDEKKKELFNNSSLLILPSYHEGLPMSILEAMAAGLEIISTNVGGIAEAVENGVNGFLIKAGDIDALAEKTILLLKNQDVRREIGQKNKLKIQQIFDVEKIIIRLMEIYASIL